MIVGFCEEMRRKIELNIWVDNDLNSRLLIANFPKLQHNLIDTVYYRFDDEN